MIEIENSELVKQTEGHMLEHIHFAEGLKSLGDYLWFLSLTCKGHYEVCLNY